MRNTLRVAYHACAIAVFGIVLLIAGLAGVSEGLHQLDVYRHGTPDIRDCRAISKKAPLSRVIFDAREEYGSLRRDQITGDRFEYNSSDWNCRRWALPVHARRD